MAENDGVDVLLGVLTFVSTIAALLTVVFAGRSVREARRLFDDEHRARQFERIREIRELLERPASSEWTGIGDWSQLRGRVKVLLRALPDVDLPLTKRIAGDDGRTATSAQGLAIEAIGELESAAAGLYGPGR